MARWIIVDGYNLLGRMPSATRPDFGESGRHRLLQMLEEVATCLAERITVVFDGHNLDHEPAAKMGCVETLFSPSHLDADTVIEQLVGKSERPQEILVVTSDIAERKTVEASGAESMSSDDFIKLCSDKKQQIGKIRQSRPKRTSPFLLGDFFPHK